MFVLTPHFVGIATRVHKLSAQNVVVVLMHTVLVHKRGMGLRAQRLVLLPLPPTRIKPLPGAPSVKVS